MVSASQLAIENFAKAVVAVFEVPTWSHDPSSQLESLISRSPNDIADNVKELANLVRGIAPEHGRSTYGELSVGLLPSDIYEEVHALNTLESSSKARRIAE